MPKKKLTTADIDKVRHLEGFPIARDEDIITLSDPPYYTACPNPFIEDFIREHGRPYDEASDDYHREPFAADVSEGKNDPIYNAHSYHTKVPHRAIMRYILHYTNPGDIVFDGFCGSGMTGVAAQMCGNPDTAFKMQIEQEMPGVEWGARKAILSDLSPAATFIAYNYNTPVDVAEFQREAERILVECEAECGWMYETQHVLNGELQRDVDGKPIMGRINYTVWSDVFICPTCSGDIVFYSAALDKSSEELVSSFRCDSCGAVLKKDECRHSVDLYYDAVLNENHQINRQIPALINYSLGKKRYEKVPDEYDREILERINVIFSKKGIHSYPMLHKGGENWGDIWRAGYHFGMTHSHHFYTQRNLYIISYLWEKANSIKVKWAITAVLNYVNKKQSYTGGGGGMPGVLYIASLVQEKSVIDVLRRKIRSLGKVYAKIAMKGNVPISTGSSTRLQNICDQTIDYIFVDPPFGSNIMYSEASFLLECWLKIFTENHEEAVASKCQSKNLRDYQALILKCFMEFYRILKPGRWITIEFHNSKNAVWNAIRDAVLRAGFILADVRILDKKQGSFKQVTTYGAVQQDLIISAYKPRDSFKREFIAQAGNDETAWAFTRQHLENLPVAVLKSGHVEIIAERQKVLLFDRMVAYHVIHGITIPLDSADFYQGLEKHFLKRDDMYFLSSQISEYDNTRLNMELEPMQFELVVSNERSAIAWLYQQLATPRTYGELQPKYMQECRTWDKHETSLELSLMLSDYFLQDDTGRWYIPDHTKEADRVKLREKNLLKEFESILGTKGKIRQVRTEAVRVGFARLWAEGNYPLIVATAERLPESLIQEDEKLLMYYDLSLGRV